MALSQAYGKLEIPMIDDDEPIFILRAQDILAVSAIQMYRLLAEAHGCQVAEVLTREVEAFQSWVGERRLPAWPASNQVAQKGHTVPAGKRKRTSDGMGGSGSVPMGMDGVRQWQGAEQAEDLRPVRAIPLQ